MEKTEKTVEARLRGIPAETWKRFRILCIQRGVSLNEQLKRLVEEWVEEEAERGGKP